MLYANTQLNWSTCFYNENGFNVFVILPNTCGISEIEAWNLLRENYKGIQSQEYDINVFIDAGLLRWTLNEDPMKWVFLRMDLQHYIIRSLSFVR